MTEDKLIIEGIEFKSRLWIGTGKYKDFDETRRAVATNVLRIIITKTAAILCIGTPYFPP